MTAIPKYMLCVDDSRIEEGKTAKLVSSFAQLKTGKSYQRLQKSISIRPADIGRYALAIQMDASDRYRFMTPLTATDAMYWGNGLDGKESVEECLAVFASSREAQGACRHRFTSLRVFKLILDDEAGMIRLILEKQIAAGRGAAQTS